MQRISLVWVSFIWVLSWLAVSCGGEAMTSPAVPQSGMAQEKSYGHGEAKVATVAATSAEDVSESRAEPEPSPASDAVPAAPPPVVPTPEEPEAAGQEPAPEGPTPRKRMLEIEARLDIEVADVSAAADQLRQLLLSRGATITQDSISHNDGAERAQFTFRIPSGSASGVLAEVERLGLVHDKNVLARDVSKEYFDTELRLHNLETTLLRYTQLLKEANAVDELIRIEHELTRLRGEIEQLKGTLRYMRDRVAQATVYVTLWAPNAYVEDVVHPEAGLYPGVRLGWVYDAGPDQPTNGLLSLGVSARFFHRLSFDADVLRQFDAGGNEVDGFWLTVGADRYSEFLGNGQRRYLNPYLGFRVGYGHRDHDEFVVGITTGLELIKAEIVTLELDIRTLGLFSKGSESRLGVQPTLGCNVAF